MYTTSYYEFQFCLSVHWWAVPGVGGVNSWGKATSSLQRNRYDKSHDMYEHVSIATNLVTSSDA